MLRRTLLTALLTLAPSTLLAQSTLDKVTFRRDGQLVTESGEIKDTPRGVELTAGPETKLIPAQDLVRVDTGTVAGVALGELSSARGLEEAGDPAKAQAAFAELIRKAAAAPESSRRYLAFREANAAARAVATKSGAEFTSAAKPIVARLLAVGKDSTKSWQAWPAHRTAARMQAELGDVAGATATLKALGAIDGLSKDQKQNALLTAASYQVRAGNDPAAREILGEVEKEGVADSLRETFAILKAAGTPGLKSAVDAATDPAAKGIGYTLLGAAQEKAGNPREAMWDYLWTEAVYSDDTDATVAALRRLVAIFEKQGNKERAEQFRDKLTRVRVDA